MKLLFIEKRKLDSRFRFHIRCLILIRVDKKYYAHHRTIFSVVYYGFPRVRFPFFDFLFYIHVSLSISPDHNKHSPKTAKRLYLILYLCACVLCATQCFAKAREQEQKTNIYHIVYWFQWWDYADFVLSFSIVRSTFLERFDYFAIMTRIRHILA